MIFYIATVLRIRDTQIEAAFKISFASRRSASSFFNRLISANSSLVGPGRDPSSA
jgi:hypothetical protein